MVSITHPNSLANKVARLHKHSLCCYILSLDSCSSLSAVLLPKSLSKVGKSVCKACDDLKNIIILPNTKKHLLRIGMKEYERILVEY